MTEYKLCYVRGGVAFFTTQPLEKQWGDDWNDAPYEHNAGDPYEWNGRSNEPEWEIKIVQFKAPMITPDEYTGGNSRFSVEMINRGDIAWLRPDYTPKGKPIHAGVSIEEFKRLIWFNGGDILTYEQKPFFDEPARIALETYADEVDATLPECTKAHFIGAI